MSSTLFPATVAIVFGALISLALVVPFAAVQYRRRGRLGVGVALLGFVCLVYFLALATYTLLPLPARTADFCAVHGASPQLVPGRFVADVIREGAGRTGIASIVRNPALLQIVFNVGLFVPLGMIVRHFGRRPVVVTALIGLGASLLIETTQLTGDWFLYPCSYRLFDVDDLIANTAGALVGAGLAPLLRAFPGQRPQDPGVARPVTAVRRLLGMLCDWSIVAVGGVTLTAAYVAVTRSTHSAPPAGLDEVIRVVAGPGILALIELGFVLVAKRTLGEIVVRLRPVADDRLTVGRAFVRWLFGIGGYAALSMVPGGEGLVGFLLVAVSLVLAFTSRGHRGLAFAVVGWKVEDDRE